jgi:beta-phosphoglucomutase-like phosphatase (HAD superfamily)
MNPIKAIIFDVDGVLIKSKNEQGEYIWSKDIEAELGIDEKCLTSIYSGNWNLVMQGKLDMQQHVAHVFSELSVDLSVDSFIDYWLKNDLKINDDIITLIRQLKTHKRYLGTNQDFLRAAVIWSNSHTA